MLQVSGFPLDLNNWFLQFITTAFLVAFGLLYLVKNTASKYFFVDANFESSGDYSDKKMPAVNVLSDACAVCSNSTTKQCSGCKMVKYCSADCQRSHWNSGHKTKCKQSASVKRGWITSTAVPRVKQLKKILFPYEEFVELFNWEIPGFRPCGLLNCGNSCFANVVLQCLAYTRPLVAYLLEKGHRRECRRNDWCFLCEFQTHLERASKSVNPFSPINILSRLPNIGGNFGYGKQEDAHEFMRFAIDTMQSVCLDEFGGEKAVHPSSQETTLIQHIFGGHLQSQVICTECNVISNQFESMMDLTVEIQGEAASLEECLDQFTAKEWLHGENMYKCDGCNDYVTAWKRLTIRQPPNILTIALKRFQSGRFGKLNKRVTFPERLDLSPYMSETGNGTDFYNLYAVVVHMDMLNASFFGHYICYTKDFCGNWCRIDDCKVATVELDEVLSQGAYMLLYSRVYARPSCLNRVEPLRKEEQGVVEMAPEVTACPKEPAGSLLSDGSSESKVSSCEEELSSVTEDAAVQAFNCEGEFSSIGEDQDEVRSGPTSKDIKVNVNGSCIDVKESVLVVEDQDMVGSGASLSPKDVEVHSSESCNEVNDSVLVIEQAHELVSGPGVTTLTDTYSAEACTLKHEQPAPVSYVENRAGAGQCLIMDPLDEGSVPTQNHFCESRKTGCDDLITTLRSGEWTDEANPVDCSSKRENAESGIEGAARKLDGSSSFGLRPLTPPRYELRDSFIESSTPTQNHVWEKSEKCCDVSVGTLWSGDVLEGSYPVNIRGKQESVVSGQSLPSSTGIEDAAKKLCGSNPSGAKLRPLFPFLTEGPPCTLSDSSCEGTLRTQNFISEKSEMCRHLSVGTSWPDEVLDETHLEISSDKLETVVYGPSFPLSSITENAAGIYQGKSSSAAKPLFSPGSLEEPPQCVLTDPLIQGFAQKKSEKYQDVSISSGANSKPFSPPGFFRKLPQCVSTDSLLEGSATHNLPCEKTEMCDDVSVGILWSGEVLDEMNTAIYRGKLEKVESGNSLPSSKDDDAVGRLEGKESSGAKLKPLFARGFLRKRPRDKYNK